MEGEILIDGAAWGLGCWKEKVEISVCLDVEGVGAPENGDVVAEKVGVLEFKRARCDEPDFDGVVEISSN